MLDWVVLEDFGLMSDETNFYPYEHTDTHKEIQDILTRARSFLPGWTDDKVRRALIDLITECETFTKKVADTTENWRTEAFDCFLDGDFSIGDTVDILADTMLFKWPIDMESCEFSIIDSFGENYLINIVINRSRDDFFKWVKNDQLQQYSRQELYACLALGALSSYDYALKFPGSSFWFTPTPFREASDREILNGMENALSAIVQANVWLFKIYDEQINNRQQAVVQDQARTKESRVKIAQSGGVARSEKYIMPLKKFALEQFHKKKYPSTKKAAEDITPLVLELMEKEMSVHCLTATGAERTVYRWLLADKKSGNSTCLSTSTTVTLAGM